MSGTIIGGKKAALTNVSKYGSGFYASIGAKGGKNGKSGGFASVKVGADGLTGRERARLAGSKGGRLSKRPKGASTAIGTYEFTKSGLESLAEHQKKTMFGRAKDLLKKH